MVLGHVFEYFGYRGELGGGIETLMMIGSQFCGYLFALWVLHSATQKIRAKLTGQV